MGEGGKSKSVEEVLEEKLFASFGEVTELVPLDGNSSEPWPKSRVSTYWPSGMSGGPVLNSDGHVIGVISKSMKGNAVAVSYNLVTGDCMSR